MAQKLRVLFVASEAVPFAKTGGLADIVGTLPDALQEVGAEVKVLMPYYGVIKQNKIPMTTVTTKYPNLFSPLLHKIGLLTDASPARNRYRHAAHPSCVRIDFHHW